MSAPYTPKATVELEPANTAALSRFRSAARDRTHAAVYVSGMVFQRASLLLVLPLLLRQLTAAEYGAFGLLQSLLTLLPALLTANLPATVTRLYYDGHSSHERRLIGARLTAATLLIGVAGAAIMAIPLIAVPTVAAGLFGLPASLAKAALAFVLVGAIGSALLQASYGIWRAERLPIRAAGANVANGLLFLALVATLSVLGPLSAVRVVGAYALAAILVGGAAALLAPSWSTLRADRARRPLIGAALRFGLPMLPYILGLWILGSGGRWVARMQLGLDAVGQFTLASQIAVLLGLLGRAAFEAWAPESFSLFASGRHREAQNYLRRQTYYTLAAVAVLGLVLAAVLPFLLGHLAPQYSMAGAIFPLMLLAPVCDIAHLRWHTELTGLKRTRSIAVYTTASVAFFLVAGIAGAAAWGLWGLVAVFAAAHALQLAGASLAVWRVRRVLDRATDQEGRVSRAS